MSLVKWRGDATAAAQVSLFPVTGFDSATTYKVTRNNKTVSVLGVTSVNATAAALQAALAASTISEFLEVSWTVLSGTVTGTAKLPGVPFTFTKLTSGGTGTMGSITTTAGAGPNDISLPANWFGNALPTTGDDVVFENSSIDALWNLDHFAGVVFNSWTKHASYTGRIGLPAYSTTTLLNGYWEDRPLYFQCSPTIGNIYGGSSRVKLDCGSGQVVLNIYGSGASVEPGVGAIQWKGTHASNVVNISAGSFDVANLTGETANISVLNQSLLSSLPTDSTINTGVGATIVTINKTGGTLATAGPVTTVNQYGGLLTIKGTMPTNLNLTGGTVYPKGTGTITTAVIAGGILDCRQDTRPLTITDLTLNVGVAQIFDPTSRVVYTNPPINMLTGSTISVGVL